LKGRPTSLIIYIKIECCYIMASMFEYDLGKTGDEYYIRYLNKCCITWNIQKKNHNPGEQNRTAPVEHNINSNINKRCKFEYHDRWHS